MVKAAIVAFLLAVAGCAKPVDVLLPLPPSLAGASEVVQVEVTIGPNAAPVMEKLEEKARERAKSLAPRDPASPPSRDEYAALPFDQMFALVVRNVTRARGLNHGRPLRLVVEIDRVRRADMATAVIASSNDKLAGPVTIFDAASGERLGMVYIDVVNSHSGIIGALMRGGGIREKLAEEFALHVADALNGKAKP